MDSSYVPLRLRSNYSLLSGASSIPSLLDRAVEIGLGSVALTDLDNLYGVVLFEREARARGIRPILGATLEHTTGSGVLIARDLEGYRNLSKIVSRRQLDPSFRFTDCVSDFQGGLHVLVRDPAVAASLAGRLDRRSLWLELESPADYARVRNTAARFGLRPVATGNVFFARPSDRGRHKLLTAIRLGSTVSRLGARDVASPDAYLEEPAKFMARWQAMPEALRNGRDIAEGSDLEMPGRGWVFPRSGLAGPAAERRLSELCRRGVRWRYGKANRGVTERLARELRTIQALGYTDYFLIVGEIVRFARTRGIPTVGRGSGAGSIVAYLLGITNVDPIAYRLCFERFLHEHRDDCPDLDIDFCWRGRDEVIEHVYRTHGDERVAMISTHNRFHRRSAFREAAKAFGLSPEEVGVLGKRLRRDGWAAGHGLGSAESEAEPLGTILRLAQDLEGFPRHLGIHSGGVVIADTRLDDYLSLERSTKGIVVTQPDMHGVEALGLVKIDLLGNRALSTIRETVDLVRRGRREPLDPDRILDGDGETGDLLAEGTTLGCFQIESPGMRLLLAKLKVRSLGGTIAALSLIRPGPAGSGMKEAYVRRAQRAEAETPLHPRIERLLAETHGVMLYQEDVMRVASEVTGVSLAEADLLRRAIAGAESREALETLAGGFVGTAVGRGFEAGAARAIWDRLAQFTAYAFSKAHASGYGALAYQSTYLKAHYPAEFAAAVMNNHQGMYPKWVHLEDARRRGVSIRHPSLLASSDEFTVEDGCLRIGLGQVKGLSEGAARAIVEAREEEGPFLGLSDFLRRVKVSVPEAEALILAGALDFTGRSRPELLWALHASRRACRTAPSPRAGVLLDAGNPRRLGLREFSPYRKPWHEFRVLEVSPSEHPLGWLCRGLGREGVVALGRPPFVAGRRVRVVGVLAATRAVETSRGKRMAFLTLDDEAGPFECVLFPEVYRRARYEINGWGPYEVAGLVEEDFGVCTLTVERLRRLGPRSEVARG